jgi:hypothetical protein
LELAARGKRCALAGAVVAALAGAVTATELVARDREAAVAKQIDAIGPALTIVPRGTTPGTLARYEIAGVVPSETEAAVRRALGGQLRAIERRVVIHREVAGARRPVVGVETFVGSEKIPAPEVASIGAELGRSIPVGARLQVGRREFEVARVLPSTGSVEDLSVFLPIDDVRGLGGVDGVNELRLFLAPGVSVRDSEARLGWAAPAATVIRADRGEIADGEMQESLARHRGSAYAVMAAVGVLTLLIAAHLDAAERRVELATLVAIGASAWTVIGGILGRSAVVGGAGSAVGAMVGVAIAAANATPDAAGMQAGGLAACIAGAGLLTGLLAATPTALVCVARDPVRALQDG